MVLSFDNYDLTGVSTFLTHYYLEKSGLAGAVYADYSHFLLFLKMKRNIVQYNICAKCFADVLTV